MLLLAVAKDPSFIITGWAGVTMTVARCCSGHTGWNGPEKNAGP